MCVPNLCRVILPILTRSLSLAHICARGRAHSLTLSISSGVLFLNLPILSLSPFLSFFLSQTPLRKWKTRAKAIAREKERERGRDLLEELSESEQCGLKKEREREGDLALQMKRSLQKVNKPQQILVSSHLGASRRQLMMAPTMMNLSFALRSACIDFA